MTDYKHITYIAEELKMTDPNDTADIDSDDVQDAADSVADTVTDDDANDFYDSIPWDSKE